MANVQKIAAHLWFDHQAQDAAEYYTSIFPNSKIGRASYYTEAGKEQHHQPAGKVMTIEFYLEGQQFLALNGGPVFKFNESISFMVYCENQEEIDYYWDKLTAGGDPASQQCGWLKDKFGVSWQIAPANIGEMMAVSDKAVAEKGMAAIMKMKKIDMNLLNEIYNERK